MTLTVVWQDGKCDPVPGQDVLFKNFFDGTLFPVDEPPVNAGRIAGVLGPGCS
eukprot:CAMPEP_0179030316 /NCGR_PEP_ID=MMETSP0796-20121207/10503_1 /TAXON_ID=73915 /ORGANISM="Pyrodinium bahamense, Strain pbaha01" /LENGTH=52 /DNA_ID=CAMNT_0020726495 /DNA_START=47 /DNA_END=202 /DNA_ORIENTATION=+